MKIKNIKDVDGFFKVIDSCAGTDRHGLFGA